MDKDEKLNYDEEIQEDNVVGNNAFTIDGVITIPDGIDQDKFFDEFIYWIESKNSSFFGVTRPIENEDDGDSCVEKILTEKIGIKIDNKK